MTFSRFIHISTDDPVSFLFMAEQYSIVYMYHFFFIHSSIDGHLVCFHVLAIVNSATMNTCIFLNCFFSGGGIPVVELHPVVELLGHETVLFLVF